MKLVAMCTSWQSTALEAQYSVFFMWIKMFNWPWNRGSKWPMILRRVWILSILRSLKYCTETWNRSIYSWSKKSNLAMITSKSRWPISVYLGQKKNSIRSLVQSPTTEMPLKWLEWPALSIGWLLKWCKAIRITPIKQMSTRMESSCGRSCLVTRPSKVWGRMKLCLELLRIRCAQTWTESHLNVQQSTEPLWRDAGTRTLRIGLISR